MDNEHAPADQALAAPATPAAAPPPPAKRYAPDEGAHLELRGLDDAQLFNDDGTPMTIHLLGADSDIAVRSRNGQTTRRMAQGTRVKLTGEGLESDAIKYLAELTVGWNITPSKLVPGVDPGLGEGKVPFSTAAAVTIYRNAKLSCIKEQADTYIAERAHFLKA